MRDLIVTENITLDGVIDATEGWFDPAGGEDDLRGVESSHVVRISPSPPLLVFSRGPWNLALFAVQSLAG